MKSISCTYAYHPANQKKDLTLPLAVVRKYAFANPAMTAARKRHVDRRLEADIQTNGILYPLTIYTDGHCGLLADGYQRLGLAEKLGIKSLPVQIHPNNFRRFRTEAGFPPLEAKVKAWADKHLLKHASHYVTRHLIGSDGSMGIPANKWVKCECECGAYWKEEA